ncbi:hypothetical protein [Wolbachia endosymbiont of Tetranychus urticae]|uniref:hypothetical protein n=1 Tax=Wolbachia endosymbiont of Tetranychus urticae TaxID=169184 RepID=UPI0039786621
MSICSLHSGNWYKNEIEQSQGSPTRRGKILGIISRIINKSSDKNHSSSVIQNQKDRQGNAMELFNKQSLSGEVEIPKNSGINLLEKDSVGKGVGGTGISGTYNTLRSSGYYGDLTTPTSEQSQLNGLSSQSDLSIDCKDLKNDLDSGINSSSLASSSRRNSLTSVTSISSEESVHLKLNPAEKDNSLQLEDEGKTKLAYPNKTRPKRKKIPF